MKDDFELNAEEKQAFDNLPREQSPSKALEERIVHALQSEGILRSAGIDAAPAASCPAIPSSSPGVFAFRQRSKVPGRRTRMWLLAAASMVLSLAIFGAGLFVGQWMGTRNTERIFLSVREQDSARLAQRVQESGSAYVATLAALEKLRASAGQRKEALNFSSQAVSEIQQGQEAALAALHGAAIELARITPEDPRIALMLKILEDRRFRPAQVRNSKQALWF
jgi:hypothetical protein